MPAVGSSNAEARKNLIKKRNDVGQTAAFMRQQQFGDEKKDGGKGLLGPDGSPRRRLVTLTPQPLSTYGRAVNTFVDMHLPAGSSDPASPVKTTKEFQEVLEVKLDQSVSTAAEEGITEEQLQKQLQAEMHEAIKRQADQARDELSQEVGEAQRHLDQGQKVSQKFTSARARVQAAVTTTRKDIEGYFGELERLLAERKEQLLAEVDQRMVAMDRQLEEVNEHMAEIEVTCKAAGEASDGQDLSLLHKRPLISKKLVEATDREWPRQPVTDEDLAFHADDSIVAAIIGLGEVSGSVDEDPEAVATEELQEVIAASDAVFDDADKDGDGLLSAQELKQLVFYMYTKGGSYPDDLASRVREEVEATMDRFDKDHDHLIDKLEFKRMLCSNPWKVLLPEKARQNETLMKHYFGL